MVGLAKQELVPRDIFGDTVDQKLKAEEADIVAFRV
jgi:hypothetical protein